MTYLSDLPGRTQTTLGSFDPLAICSERCWSSQPASANSCLSVCSRCLLFPPYFPNRELITSGETVAANRHPGQVGYSHNPPQEGRDEASSLRADSSEEGEGQSAQAAACAALERQSQSDLPLFLDVQSALLHLEETLCKEWLSLSPGSG